MGAHDYARARRALLAASAWHGWAHRRGYNPAAGQTRKTNQAAMANLRARREGVSHG